MPAPLLYLVTVLIWGSSWYAMLFQVGVVPVEQSIAYRFLLELTEAETAEALGVPPGTVKSRLSRGLQRLRAQLNAGVVEVEQA